jgi:hypothetical protein
MLNLRCFLSLTAGALVISVQPIEAGPCTTDIDRLQQRVDAGLEAAAAAGPAAQENVNAKLHHQPTPGSIAGAEASLGEGARPRTALLALQRARELDQAGDATGCQQALGEVARALAR